MWRDVERKISHTSPLQPGTSTRENKDLSVIKKCHKTTMGFIPSQSNPTYFRHAFHNQAVYFNYYLKKKIMLVSSETESQSSQSTRRKLWDCYIRVAEHLGLLGCGAVSTWTSGSQHIERSHCLHNQVEAVQEALFFLLRLHKSEDKGMSVTTQNTWISNTGNFH